MDVTCIMPTRGRRAWVPLAVRCWQEQTLPTFARELIVIDDGPEPCGDLVKRSDRGDRSDDRVRYIYLQGDHSIGAKLNLGCELARADVMATWSDDDYHAPWRLEYQLDELRRSDATVCGTDSLFYWDPRRREAWLYEWAPGVRSNGYVTGGTMMWRREFWQARNYDTLPNSGEDTRWIMGRGPLLGTLNRRFYLATLHPGNTGPKPLEMLEASSHWNRVGWDHVGEIAAGWWVDAVMGVVGRGELDGLDGSDRKGMVRHGDAG